MLPRILIRFHRCATARPSGLWRPKTRSLTSSCNSTPNKQYRQIKTNCANKNAVLKADAISQRIEYETNVELSDLELDLGTGESKDLFNLTWLRDSCHCGACTHQFSRQRLFTPKDFRKHLFIPAQISFHQNMPKEAVEQQQMCWPKSTIAPQDGPILQISWADGHQSFYPVAWLRQIAAMYGQPRLSGAHFDSINQIKSYEFPQDDFYMPTEANSQMIQHWTVSEIDRHLKPVDFGSLTHGFDFAQFQRATFINANKVDAMSPNRLQAMSLLTEQLTTFGLAKIVNVPQEPGQVLNVVRSLAYERPTGYGTVFDVVVEPNEEINLAYSAQEFDLHSDLTYRESSPGVQLLHCIRNSTVGGLSYFADAFKAAQQLRQVDQKLFNLLLKFPATFVVRDPYRNVNFRRHHPIISLDFRGNLKEVYFSPFMLPPIGHKDDVKLFYLAIDKFTQILQSQENKLIAKMEPGDLFIFNNRRVLHGRSAYDPTSSSRFLQGCYMDWDELVCLHEKLHSR